MGYSAPWELTDGKRILATASASEYRSLRQRAQKAPLKVASLDGSAVWNWNADVFLCDPDLDADDVAALAGERENKKRLRLQKAHALKAMSEQLDTKAKRQPIPQDVKVLVWQRDGGRCVECGSNQNLEYDHIIPLAMGGSNTDRNIQLLCEDCNRRKGATLG